MKRRKDRPTKGTGNKTVSIIVDGQTEQWYFQMLRDTEELGQLTIRPELPSKKTLAHQFDLVCTNAKEYDHVIWLIDADTIIKEIRESNEVSKIQEIKGYFSGWPVLCSEPFYQSFSISLMDSLVNLAICSTGMPSFFISRAISICPSCLPSRMPCFLALSNNNSSIPIVWLLSVNFSISCSKIVFTSELSKRT